MDINKTPDTQNTGKLSLKNDERGLTTVEYIIVLCLIVVVGWQAWTTFGQTVADQVEATNDNVIGTLPNGGDAN